MNIFKIGIIGIIATVLLIVIKKESPHISILISTVTGVLIFFMIITGLDEVFSSLFNIIKQLDVRFDYIGVILKIIGISYISEFCSQICIDSGQSAIASKIELGGKVCIIIISIPIINDLLDVITKLMP